MNKTKQLENRIKLLESKLNKQKRKWYLFPIFLIFLTICGGWIYFSIKYFGLFEIFGLHIGQITFKHLEVIPNIFFNCLLISFVFISLTAWIKNGFNKLKRYEECGLIFRLIFGFTNGLFGGLIIGLGLGGIVSIIMGLVGGLIGGLIIGLIAVLILGLFGGLIFGLIEEFRR